MPKYFNQDNFKEEEPVSGLITGSLGVSESEIGNLRGTSFRSDYRKSGRERIGDRKSSVQKPVGRGVNDVKNQAEKIVF